MYTQDHNIRQYLPNIIQVIREIYSDVQWELKIWFLGEGEIYLQDYTWKGSKYAELSWRKRRMLQIFLSRYIRLEISLDRKSVV